MYMPWAQQKGQMGYMNQESRMLQGPINYNAANLYPQPNANWSAAFRHVYHVQPMDGILLRISVR